MKKIIGLLVIAQFICLAHSAQVKRVSDACPGSNNKSSTSKEYAHLSKRSGGDNDFSNPKYQSIYEKNTSLNTTTRKGKAISKEESTISQKSTRHPSDQAEPEKQKLPIVTEENNRAIKAVSEPEAEDEDEFESMPSEKKTETSKPFDVIQAKKAVSSESKPVVKEEGKTASSPEDFSGTKKSEKASSPKESSMTKNGSTNTADLTTTKAVKQKQQKKNTTKKLRLGKKCSTDCPEF